MAKIKGDKKRRLHLESRCLTLDACHVVASAKTSECIMANDESAETWGLDNAVKVIAWLTRLTKTSMASLSTN